MIQGFISSIHIWGIGTEVPQFGEIQIFKVCTVLFALEATRSWDKHT